MEGKQKGNYLFRLLLCVINIAGALESLTPEKFAESALKKTVKELIMLYHSGNKEALCCSNMASL